MKKYYNEDYAKSILDLDEKGNTFDKISDVWQESKRPMRILDIGCGAGSVSAELVKKGHEVYGFDLMEEAVRRAQKRGLFAEVYDINRIPFPFQARYFDCILALDILEHVFDPLSVLKEINRILAQSGYAIIFLPLHFDMYQRIRILLGKGIISHEHFIYDPHLVSWNYFHIRFFTLQEISHFIAAGRFVIKDRVYRPMVTGNMPRLLRFLLKAHTLDTLASRFPACFASGIKLVVVKP